MSKYKGFIIYFDDERRRKMIRRRIERMETFSDTLSIFDWEIKVNSLALMAFSSDAVNYLGLAKCGKQVVSYKRRVDFSDVIDLEALPIDEIAKGLDTDVERYFIKSSQGSGGPVPDETWTKIIEIVKKLRPSLSDKIDRLISLASYSGYRLSGDHADLILQEKEAVGTSLDIFTGSNQLREKVLSSWVPSEGQVVDEDSKSLTGTLRSISSDKSGFITGLSKQYFCEEDALQHDLFNWDGLSPEHRTGISTFTHGKKRLDLVYANRNALEKTLGVDLIYYKQPLGLFVLVQYKLMRDEGKQMVYRPNDQLREELDRMNRFCDEYAAQASLGSHEDFRLNSDGFFLKLVPNRGLSPASGELIKGMYLPREYANFLFVSGPQRAKAVHFKEPFRYLTNTEFIQAVNGGWIGTRGIGTNIIRSVVTQFLESGKAVLLANEREIKSKAGAGQSR